MWAPLKKGVIQGSIKVYYPSDEVDINQTEKFPEQVSNTLRTNYSSGFSNETYIGELEYIGAIMTEKNKKWLKEGKELSREFPQGQRVYSSEGISSANPMSDVVPKVSDGMKIRRLTPKECERLQGFPDGWTEEGTQGKISDTQRYKTLGNAVSVPVVGAIVERLFL